MVLLQEAQLYGHFSPVALIHHPRVLSDFPSDSLGTASIWDRIKKAGADMFYRVEYPENPEGGELTDDQKTEAKNYVDGEGKSKLVSTLVADTDYIKNVIDVFVRGNKEEKNLDQLYHEPGEYYE